MNNQFVDTHLDRLLPGDLYVRNADGDRLTASNGQVYYNYFNDSLRWLCGYDNPIINGQMDKDIQVIQEDPQQINSLYQQVSEYLCLNAGKRYKKALFFSDNVYKILFERLRDQNRRFFICVSRNVFIPSNLDGSFLDLDKLLELEPNPRKPTLTPDGWDEKKIKRLFGHYKKKIAGLVLSPLELSRGTCLSAEVLELFKKLCGKYKIPIIWDESLTSFYRSGTFYMLNQYDIEPDFIAINTNISQSGATHILIPTKQANRKFLKKAEVLPNLKNAPSLIVLHSDLLFITQQDVPKIVENVSYRLARKLKALSANTHGRFGIDADGLVVFINFPNPKILPKIHNFLLNRNLLVFSNRNRSLFLLPQLTLSNRAVDLLIQGIDDFFKVGMKLPIRPS